MQLTLLKVDQQNAFLKKISRKTAHEARRDFDEQLRICWVFHDHAIEGTPLTELELFRGIDNERGKDTCEQILLTGIHRLYQAIGVVREESRKGVPVDLAYIKHLHALCAADDDPAGGRYRKGDGPLGSYLQSCVGPKSISYRLRKLVDFIEEEAPALHPIRGAAAIHHRFMQVFPFDHLSGRAGRLLLNAWLMREGYPPVVIPANLRADYYNTLCANGPDSLTELVIDALRTTIEKAQATYKQNLTPLRRAS